MKKLNTVIDDYKYQKNNSEEYQTENQLEEKLINDLQKQGYEYLPIHTEQELLSNLRKQIEKLNSKALDNKPFSDDEWYRFTNEYLLNTRSALDKTLLIQNDYIWSLKLDNGDKKNIRIIDKDNIERNCLQVINQYTTDKGNHNNRYDVTILVNGLPLVHLELKRRGIPIKDAFNQIKRYQQDSFWSGSGLFDFVQIFVISNGTNTKYYSNTTRDSAKNENNEQNTHNNKNKKKRAKNNNKSFEFTSYWADQQNKNIFDLDNFATTFLSPKTLLNILTKYCVFTATKKLLVMRPYQIAATEAIINKIIQANEEQKWGQHEARGYIWHATGSGKTLTSFKTAQLIASELKDCAEKVIFVVDRKDLDNQTIDEYNKFEEGCVDRNSSSNDLRKQLETNNKNIVVTTIQKLNRLIKHSNEINKNLSIYNKKVVFIFDECHRSQFGEMHRNIIDKFNKCYLFGFTGTPIMDENAISKGDGLYITTKSLFGQRLHCYTLKDGIADKNVLPFKITYYETISDVVKLDEKSERKARSIDDEEIFLSPRRIKNIVSDIMRKFDHHTYRYKSYTHEVSKSSNNLSHFNQQEDAKKEYESKKLNGFNAILAVSSIEAAKTYYSEFQEQNKTKNEDQRLKVGIIYSYTPNEDQNNDGKGLDEENNENTNYLDSNSRDFLENAINDYNKMFGTSWDATSDKFNSYYKDISLRMKNKELDLLIVVNMFLTGFDATTLNTLYVDKNLQMHGLIQAFSRTNRILNSVKKYGNIICYRDIRDDVKKAIRLFSDKNAHDDLDYQILLRPFRDYYEGYIDNNTGKRIEGYKELVQTLISKFPINKEIIIESEQKEFIRLFGKILSRTNLLATFEEFFAKDSELFKLSEREKQDYTGKYLDLRNEWKDKLESTKESVVDEIMFKIEYVDHESINLETITNIIATSFRQKDVNKDEAKDHIKRIMDASSYLYSVKELILNFLEKELFKKGVDYDFSVVNVKKDLNNFVDQERLKELRNICKNHGVDKIDEMEKYMEDSFEQGEFCPLGEDFNVLIASDDLFADDKDIKDNQIIEALSQFFNKYIDFYNHIGILNN